ncbi:hypothetical protein PEC730217_13360 [Pectobacterium carotovorum subsp. carotovorum]|nr:hypothetical protein PEC730217_13360 [Pectobacterium carotovorum subsp. carotovorum]
MICMKPGLSPLARGTLFDFSDKKKVARFIPAGAGNTGEITYIKVDCAVYPRWRGEHVSDSVLRDVQFGLSPLARGTR